MTKKYKHQNPHVTDKLLVIENNTLRTKLQDATRDLERLQTALRLLTSADKQTLLNAIDYIEKPQIMWSDPPLVFDTSPTIATYTGTTTYGSTITIGTDKA